MEKKCVMNGKNQFILIKCMKNETPYTTKTIRIFNQTVIQCNYKKSFLSTDGGGGSSIIKRKKKCIFIYFFGQGLIFTYSLLQLLICNLVTI